MTDIDMKGDCKNKQGRIGYRSGLINESNNN